MPKIALTFWLLASSVALADVNPPQQSWAALWPRRDEPAALAALEAQADAAVRAHPTDFEALSRAAALTRWRADGATDTNQKAALGKEAWQLGDRATKANPKAVNGYYFAALGIGAYSQAVGVMKALGEGLESKFNERLDTAIKLAPDFEAGGGLVAKGRYYYELPWPKRDLGKSREWLERALKAHPENLRAYVYLAQTLLKDGKAREAQVALTHALQGSVAYDPPEGRRAKVLAEPVAAQIQKELK